MKLFMLGVLSLCFFMFTRPCHAVRLRDDMWGFDYPMVLNGTYQTYITKNTIHYNTQEFPIYIGYITLGRDRTFTFTKETEHPIERLEEVLRRIEATREVPLLFDAPQYYPVGKGAVTIQEEDFTRELNRILAHSGVQLVGIIDQGQAKNYTYTFKEHNRYDPKTLTWSKTIKDYMENTIKTPKNPQ